MDSTYLYREIKEGEYEVTKWEEWGGKRPNETYFVILNEWEERECTCIGCRVHGYCKHVVMIRKWLREGKPIAIPIVLGLGPWGWGMGTN